MLADVLRHQDPVQDIQDRRAARPQRVRQDAQQELEGEAAAGPGARRLHPTPRREPLRREGVQRDALGRDQPQAGPLEVLPHGHKQEHSDQ